MSGIIRMFVIRLIGAAAALMFQVGYDVKGQTPVDPGSPGPCAVTSQIVQVGGDMETHIHYPSSDQCGAGITGGCLPSAPYPAIAFAHGFSMFGLTNGAADNAGNGEHLASWGYVVAIPILPDDAEGRIADVQDVLSYLEDETNPATATRRLTTQRYTRSSAQRTRHRS